jgi:hypothetical protein
VRRMKKNLLLLILISSLFFLFSQLGTAQVNEYSLVPVNLMVNPGGGTVEVDINIKIIEEYGMIKVFFVPLFAEGTSNPVLDTVLTGGLMDAYPPAFYPPSLVDYFSVTTVNPYGPPTDPLYFLAMNFGQAGIIPPAKGLYCRMFYHVDGPGTLTFRTAVDSTGGPVLMNDYYGSSVPINWPPEGEVGSFEITAIQPGDANRDEQITVSDVIFLINYFFKSGFSPIPLIAGDANCDGQVTVSDVVYLINYLFKSGPPPC